MPYLRLMAPFIDGYLGLRSTLIGYQYSEITLAMLCNFCCGGDVYVYRAILTNE